MKIAMLAAASELSFIVTDSELRLMRSGYAASSSTRVRGGLSVKASLADRGTCREYAVL